MSGGGGPGHWRLADISRRQFAKMSTSYLSVHGRRKEGQFQEEKGKGKVLSLVGNKMHLACKDLFCSPLPLRNQMDANARRSTSFSESLFDEAECFHGGATCDLVRIRIRRWTPTTSDSATQTTLPRTSIPSNTANSNLSIPAMPTSSHHFKSHGHSHRHHHEHRRHKSHHHNRRRHHHHHTSSRAVSFAAFGRRFHFRMRPDSVDVRYGAIFEFYFRWKCFHGENSFPFLKVAKRHHQQQTRLCTRMLLLGRVGDWGGGGELQSLRKESAGEKETTRKSHFSKKRLSSLPTYFLPICLKRPASLFSHVPWVK